jgi:hypothetical protein
MTTARETEEDAMRDVLAVLASRLAGAGAVAIFLAVTFDNDARRTVITGAGKDEDLLELIAVVGDSVRSEAQA